ncbi:hypothetical protein N7471_012863 [Penicillium samsonianum]|uniref:uncharacterized protein n=1 Tax=Penicillium samsonianum TaxID=1882272 RepID=UPI002549084E|nr:uncharacterized protein N7471_012863 [Penicillium samsonianum]KAJ6125546.1 hypothetical protein N7471_012863 [Penicillium samsonianum]
MKSVDDDNFPTRVCACPAHETGTYQFWYNSRKSSAYCERACLTLEQLPCKLFIFLGHEPIILA